MATGERVDVRTISIKFLEGYSTENGENVLESSLHNGTVKDRRNVGKSMENKISGGVLSFSKRYSQKQPLQNQRFYKEQLRDLPLNNGLFQDQPLHTEPFKDQPFQKGPLRDQSFPEQIFDKESELKQPHKKETTPNQPLEKMNIHKPPFENRKLQFYRCLTMLFGVWDMYNAEEKPTRKRCFVSPWKVYQVTLLLLHWSMALRVLFMFDDNSESEAVFNKMVFLCHTLVNEALGTTFMVLSNRRLNFMFLQVWRTPIGKSYIGTNRNIGTAFAIFALVMATVTASCNMSLIFMADAYVAMPGYDAIMWAPLQPPQSPFSMGAHHWVFTLAFNGFITFLGIGGGLLSLASVCMGCRMIQSQFVEFTMKLKRKLRDDPSGVDIESMRQKYEDLCDTVGSVNKAFAPFVGMLILGLLTCLCLASYGVISFDKGPVYSLFLVGRILLGVVQLVILLTFGCCLNEAVSIQQWATCNNLQRN